ncbi:MAG TPA: amidohydrolase family protein [Burkholderiales bacterium]|jgi:predicted TIM-barrel fold metal-dependent hydrolase|nr:amidohydrolase family protein [Burkholderiales bacterium]
MSDQRKPKRALPAGSIDCHAHIFDRFDQYPLAASAKYRPAEHSREDYLALLAQMGVKRGVQINATPYGFDNTITKDFIAGDRKNLKAIAVIHPEIAEAELKMLDAAGFVGARLMDQFPTGATTAMLESIAARIKPYGWHIEINITKADDWVGLEQRLFACPVPLVFDHIGRVRGGEGVESPGFQVVKRLLTQRDDCWTKISSWYRLSDVAAPAVPAHTDMQPLVRAVLAARPDRCVWASNWPHSGINSAPPDDIDLVDELEAWWPNDAVREAVYVRNAEKLYGFAPA